ncbi:transposase [Salmonella enterica]|nr:transposase [Salmonella enterica]
MSDIQKNVSPGRPKGCLNYPPEFKQRLIEASFQPGVSISRLALDNGINANLLFKWRQKWRQGKIKLSSESGRESQLRSSPSMWCKFSSSLPVQ